ncbi:MAG: hypothetical protein ACRDYE_04380 [Acidimicrobiales bacterium]
MESIPWFHSIDLGGGVVTDGASEIQIPDDRFPSFVGHSVLDIGAWDGYYSFMAERLGARRVVALDHYAWGVDIAARGEYWTECAAQGTLPDLSLDLTEFWRPNYPDDGVSNSRQPGSSRRWRREWPTSPRSTSLSSGHSMSCSISGCCTT